MPKRKVKSDIPDTTKILNSVQNYVRNKRNPAPLIRYLRSKIVKECLAEGITDPSKIHNLALRVTQGITPGSINAIKAWDTIRRNKIRKVSRAK